MAAKVTVNVRALEDFERFVERYPKALLTVTRRGGTDSSSKYTQISAYDRAEDVWVTLHVSDSNDWKQYDQWASSMLLRGAIEVGYFNVAGY